MLSSAYSTLVLAALRHQTAIQQDTVTARGQEGRAGVRGVKCFLNCAECQALCQELGHKDA